MRKILNWIRNDFNSVRMALSYLLNKKCPLWVTLVWYVIWTPIVIALSPLIAIWYYRLNKELKKILND